MRQSLDLGALYAGLFQGTGKLVSYRADVALRTARGNDHMIGHGSLFRNVERGYLFRLGIFQACEDGFQCSR